MKNIDKYAPINFPLTISILGSFLFDYNEFRIRGTQFFPLGSILLNSYGQIFFCFYRSSTSTRNAACCQTPLLKTA